MAANTIITSVVTGGTNSHTTVAEEVNAYATDFVTQGVVGAITLNTGSGGTGSFCVNADASPDMGITVKAGQAYISATPSSQDAQVLRARASSDYTAYTINANSSGSTKYDWIYLKVDATKANTPAADASDVTSIYTSRSSSNTTDNGSPPTYGLLLAIVTVANGASSITNSNITDKRFNTSIGAQNGSLIVTQNGTGTDAIVQTAGIDANINLKLVSKGTGNINLAPASSGVVQIGGTQIGAQAFKNPYKFRVHLTTATNTGNGAAVKIPFNVKDIDTGSNFDAVTNFRFTAPAAGFYSFFGRASTSSATTTNRIIVYLYKNGVAVSRGSDATAQFTGSVVTDMLSLAASDYVELWVFGNTALALDVSDTTTCYFGGWLVSAT